MPSATVTIDTKLSRLRDVALTRLAAAPVGGYAETAPLASEPTAWGALALLAAGQTSAARRAADWLAGLQTRGGSVGVNADERDPGWPTALAILAWGAVDPDHYSEPIGRGAAWALAQEPWTAEGMTTFAHDASIEGWSWAPHTHSWLEPTAFFLLALRANGYGEKPRVRQAVALLIDRLLPSGGVNYGNTIVLGQELMQHLQPTGIAAWALAQEKPTDPRWPLTLEYLQTASLEPTGVTSLCYAALGLSANQMSLEPLFEPLVRAGERVLEESSHYKTALFALASQAALSEATPLPWFEARA